MTNKELIILLDIVVHLEFQEFPLLPHQAKSFSNQMVHPLQSQHHIKNHWKKTFYQLYMQVGSIEMMTSL